MSTSSKRAHGAGDDASGPFAPIWIRALFLAIGGASLCSLVLAEVDDWRSSGSDEIPAFLAAEVLDRPAPDFSLYDGRDRSIELIDLRGKTVLLSFWATWCPSCVDELPELAELERQLAGRGLVVVAASVDEDWAEVELLLGDDEPSFAVVWDEGARVARSYGTFKYPESYLIDRDGRVRARFVGSRSWASPEVVAFFESFARQ